MTRFLITLLCVQLAVLGVSCGSPSSGLSAAEAYEAARQATRDGDSDRAVDLLAEAADAGHLDALGSLARGYETGVVLIGLVRPDQAISIRASPLRARRYQRAYDRALADSVRAEHPRALLQAAVQLMGARIAVQNREDIPPALRQHWDAIDIDSVRALYGRVDPTDLHGFDLTEYALLGGALGDTTVAMSLYDRAAAEGDPGACIYKVQALHGPADVTSAVGLAAHADQLAACADHFPQASYLDGIRQSARNGAVRSAEVLDSLETLGLFDRFPQLAAAQ